MAIAAPRTTRDRLVLILERYVSHITVESILATVLAQREPFDREITTSNVMSVVEDVMTGLRLFCDKDRLPELMLELADFCDHETMPWSMAAPLSLRGTQVTKTAAE